jgi:hypothetical protein
MLSYRLRYYGDSSASKARSRFSYEDVPRGSGASNSGSMRTLPADQSVGPSCPAVSSRRTFQRKWKPWRRRMWNFVNQIFSSPFSSLNSHLSRRSFNEGGTLNHQLLQPLLLTRRQKFAAPRNGDGAAGFNTRCRPAAHLILVRFYGLGPLCSGWAALP